MANYDEYTPAKVPRTAITKPSLITDADSKRIRSIREAYGDEAKSLNDVFGGSEYVSDLYTNPGLSSTRDLDVDWSNFANHAFFGSAENYVTTAFNRVLNTQDGYPYYGTQEQYQTFINDLTGFEFFVLQNWPSNTGFIHFNSASYIISRDVPNALLAAERDLSGLQTINPKTGSMTVEFWLNPTLSAAPTPMTGTIFDYTNGSQGYVIDVTTGSNGLLLRSYMMSGSRIEMATTAIPESFEHYACVFNRARELDDVRIYANSSLSGTSDRLNEIGAIDVSGVKFYLGVNNAGSTAGGRFMSGSLDEFRIWGSIRTPEQLRLNAKRTIRAQSNLNLAYTFNEPANNSRSIYVIDHSGQEIHGALMGTTDTNTRQTTGSISFGENPMTYETPEPVLFSTYTPINDYYTTLLTEAIQYDMTNPNLITKLIPEEILKMSKTGLDPSMELLERQETLSQYSSIILGNTNQKTSEFKGVLEGFLYMMAKVFDELKIYIDQYKQMGSDSYSGRRFPDKLLDNMLQQYGIDLRGLFSETSLNQFFNGESVQVSGDLVAQSLEQVRAVIWRRVFNSTVGLLKSKGTRESLNGMFRAIGIDPDSNFRIKEFGGFNQTNIQNRYVRDSRLTPFMDLNSGSLVMPAFSIFTSSIAPAPDGFHVEFLVQLPNDQVSTFPQSLGRIEWANVVSGTYDVYSQCVAYSSMGGDPRISFIYQPVSSSYNPIEIDVSGEFFNGEIYRVAYGRKLFNSGTYGDVSGTYYLSVNAVEYDDIEGVQFASTTGTVDRDVIAYGADLVPSATSFQIQNVFGTNFSGVTEVYAATLPAYTRAEYKLAEIHTYNTGILDENVRTVHEKNPFSIAIGSLGQPLFLKEVTGLTGSPSNLKIVMPHGNLYNVVQLDQVSGSVDDTLPVISSSIAPGGFNGLVLTNFAQTYYQTDLTLQPTGTYSLFSSSQEVGVDPRLWNVVNFKELTAEWDRNGADDLDRIVVREGENSVFPNPELLPTYDPRVSIDFSVVDALNNDIILVLSSLDKLGEAISTYNNRYTYDFTELQYLRRVYFKRLEDKIQLQEFFKFFKFFDDNMIDFITPLIPARVEFLGGRFVVEPHALERSKWVYQDYNGLFLPGTSPREVRDAASVGVLVGFASPVGSEVGGITGDYLHRGGAQVKGVNVAAHSPTRGSIRVESAFALPNGSGYTIAAYGPDKVEQRRYMDFDEALQENYKYNIFAKGDSDFMRFLFGRETF